MAVLVTALVVSESRAAPPKVVVTIKPLHSLMTAIMEGVAEPKLLIQGGISPHGYVLRPSDVKDLDEAEVVVWVGAILETALNRRFADLAESTFVVSPLEFPGMTILKLRSGTEWKKPREEHSGERSGDHDIAPNDVHSWIDPHIWLDPKNARAFTNTMVGILSGIDRENASVYARNGKDLNYRLIALDRELKMKLKSVHDTPYLVFHDGYHYFEHHFRLRPIGSLTAHPDEPPTPRQVKRIKDIIGSGEARCIFGEPQFRSKMVQSLLDETGATLGLLDPLGAELDPGPNLYFTVMRRVSESLIGCLSTNIS